MKYKQVVKLIIDIAMYLIFVALMQEHLWDGLHEWLGIARFTLFIVHTILNFRWYQSLFKGKYTPTRTTSAVINIVLFAAMLYGKFGAGFGKGFCFSEFGRCKDRQDASPRIDCVGLCTDEPAFGITFSTVRKQTEKAQTIPVGRSNHCCFISGIWCLCIR